MIWGSSVHNTLDPDVIALTKTLFAPLHRFHGIIPFKQGSTLTHTGGPALETDRRKVPGDDHVFRQCSSIGDSEDDEERGDDLLVTTVNRQRSKTVYRKQNAARTWASARIGEKMSTAGFPMLHNAI
jgi:hypothetical protein